MLIDTKSQIIASLKSGTPSEFNFDEVDANWLGNLLTGEGEVRITEMHHKGLHLIRATLIGDCDWSDQSWPQFKFEGCTFNSHVHATRLKVNGFGYFIECSAPSINLEDSLIQGDMVFSESVFHGKDLSNSELLNFGVKLDSVRINGYLHLHNCQVNGMVNFSHSLASGFIAEGINISNRSQVALFLEGSEIKSDVNLTASKIDGQVRIKDAKIGGSILFIKSAVQIPQDSEFEALICTRMHVVKNFNLERSTILGGVNFSGSEILGQVKLSAAKINTVTKSAISAWESQVGKSLFMDDGFTCNGEINLQNSRFGSSIFFPTQ